MGRAGRGGGGGGGRSGGFSGGGRSSGGFSGGGRSSGGFSGGSRGGSSWGGSSWGGGSGGRSGRSSPPPPPPPRSGGWGYRPTRTRTVFIPTGGGRSYGGGGGGGSYNNSGGQRSGGGNGCLATVMAVVLVMLVLGLIFAIAGGGPSTASPSTVAREALPSGSVNETGYYTDELGWIVDTAKLQSGMKSFYKETGVQPYLYLTDTVGGSHSVTPDSLADYSAELYDQLFTDEAHFLVVYHEYGGQYTVGYTAGSQAKSVMDDEAVGIFRDYLDRYYTSDYSDEEYFSKVFGDTGKRIMTVTKSPWPGVLTLFGVVILAVVLFLWWKKAKERKDLERRRTEELLKTPLETFGDTDAEDLARKYENENGSEPAPASQEAPAGAGHDNE